MPDSQCNETMQLLNAVFGTGLIFNDGHEILERLEAGDKLVDIVGDLNQKFGDNGRTTAVRRVIEGWPEHHLEAVGEVLRWALGKLDTEERITIKYRGDAESPGTVTRFELDGRTLTVEFAHPPLTAAR